MKLLPIHPSLVALTALPLRGGAVVSLQALSLSLETGDELAPRARSAPGDAGEPAWRSAYQRRRAQDDEPPVAEPQPVALPLAAGAPRDAVPEVAEVRAMAPATVTTERVDALRQLAEPNPAFLATARTWQVELPAAAGPAWQLHVEQAQPLAPLTLELRVPAVAQAQARQQLSDLDKRLRDAGHDVLRPRVRDAARGHKRARPADEVDS